MARVCEICEKKKIMGNTRKLLRGHYNITGRREFKPNLQKTIIDGIHVLACTTCIRTQSKAGRE